MGAQAIEGELEIRFADVVQDGRLRLDALPGALHGVLWPKVLRDRTWRGLQRDGVVPMLTRITLSGGAGPAPVGLAQVVGTSELARVEDDVKVVERIVLLLACEVRAGGTALGQLLAEYTLLRPAASRSRRILTKLPSGEVPEARHASDAAAGLMALRRSVDPLDAISTDPARVAFGLDDTDGTRQVTTAALLGRYREAAQRRLVALGHAGSLMLRKAELGQRRPCLAGEVHTVELRAFRGPDGVGAVCALGPEDATAKRSGYARLSFGE